MSMLKHLCMYAVSLILIACNLVIVSQCIDAIISFLKLLRNTDYGNQICLNDHNLKWMQIDTDFYILCL